MDLSYFIMEVLRKHSSPPEGEGPGPLNQEEIREKMEEMFPCLKERLRPPPNPEQKTPPRSHVIRISLKKLMDLMETLPEKEQFLRCIYRDGKIGPVPDYGKKIAGYWAADPLNFRDEEVRFLIDSVMYSGILAGGPASDLARRLQKLRGEKLRRKTPYVGGGFGKGRIKVSKDTDLWNNLEVILDAIEAQKQISFVLNTYEIKLGKIVLWPEKEHTLIPLELVLNNGRYYLLGVYEGKEKVYSFRVDLMSKVVKKPEAPGKDRRSVPGLAAFQRGDYQREHPIQFGGDVRSFTLRVWKEYLTPVVDTFGENLRLLPNTMSGETVDVVVEASEGAMERWLVQQRDYLQAVGLDPSFRTRMQERIRILQEKYG